MKQRTITTAEQLNDAANSLRLLGGRLPIVVTVTEGTKTRTGGQNRRYWADMDFFLEQIDEAIEQFAEQAGYTNFEARRVVAEFLEPQHAAILFVRKKEAAHEILKMICNIPTSTRLGTKSFQKFERVLEQTMAEILGSINSVVRQAA